jgi:hypothetical protein
VSDYKVGQVLFVIPADTATVTPVQVMERRISETADGTVVRHIVKRPQANSKPIILETVKGAIFADLSTVRDVMIKNATSAIDGMVRHASNVAKQAFMPAQQKQQVQRQEKHDDSDPFASASDAYGSDDDIDVEQTNDVIEQSAGFIASQSQVQDMAGPPADVMLPDGGKKRVRLKSN